MTKETQTRASLLALARGLIDDLASGRSDIETLVRRTAAQAQLIEAEWRDSEATARFSDVELISLHRAGGGLLNYAERRRARELADAALMKELAAGLKS